MLSLRVLLPRDLLAFYALENNIKPHCQLQHPETLSTWLSLLQTREGGEGRHPGQMAAANQCYTQSTLHHCP